MKDTRMVDCEQFKCSYHPENDSIPRGRAKDLLVALCPVCAECKADQHIINPSCKNCLLCESREGYIRLGQPKPMLDITISQEVADELGLPQHRHLTHPVVIPNTPINKKE